MPHLKRMEAQDHLIALELDNDTQLWITASEIESVKVYSDWEDALTVTIRTKSNTYYEFTIDEAFKSTFLHILTLKSCKETS